MDAARFSDQIIDAEMQIAAIEGDWQAHDYSMALMNPLMPAAAEACAACAEKQTNLTNALNYQIARRLAARDARQALTGIEAAPMMCSFPAAVRVYAEQVIKALAAYSGCYIYNTAAARHAVSDAIQQLLTDDTADGTVNIQTAMGYQDLNMENLQGLAARMRSIGEFAKAAVGATIAQNNTAPFADWESARTFFNSNFGAAYVA